MTNGNVVFYDKKRNVYTIIQVADSGSLVPLFNSLYENDSNSDKMAVATTGLTSIVSPNNNVYIITDSAAIPLTARASTTDVDTAINATYRAEEEKNIVLDFDGSGSPISLAGYTFNKPHQTVYISFQGTFEEFTEMLGNSTGRVTVDNTKLYFATHDNKLLLVAPTTARTLAGGPVFITSFIVWPNGSIVSGGGFSWAAVMASLSMGSVNPGAGEWGAIEQVKDPSMPYPTYEEPANFRRNSYITYTEPESTDIYNGPGTTSNPNPNFDNGLDSGVNTTEEPDGTDEIINDEISEDHAPSNAIETGLYRVFGMTREQVERLSDVLYSQLSEVGENLVKLLFGSPLNSIISLIEYPFDVALPGNDEIKFPWDPVYTVAVTGRKLTSEYLPINFGTIDVPRTTGLFYDFEPYSKMSLYIPYIGFVDMIPSEIVGSTISIKGWVLLTTGEMVINVSTSRGGIIASYSSAIGRVLPLTGSDFTTFYGNLINAILGAGSNGFNIESASTERSGAVNSYINAAQSNVTQFDLENRYAVVERANRNYATVVNGVIDNSLSNLMSVATSGIRIQRTNGFSPSSGRLSPQECFLLYEIPHQNVPENQSLMGYPINKEGPLSNFSGYVEVRAFRFSGNRRITLTEYNELEELLKGGVII